MKSSPTPLRAASVLPTRPVAPAAARPADPARPAAAVLQRHSGFGQLSLDLRRMR